jgi:hypothetical protein
MAIEIKKELTDQERSELWQSAQDNAKELFAKLPKSDEAETYRKARIVKEGYRFVIREGEGSNDDFELPEKTQNNFVKCEGCQ